MPTNDFLPFAGGVGANVISQSSYAALSSLLSSGFSAGTAPSNECNKVWRQSTIMAAVLAQFIVDETGANAVDDGTTATLLANLKLAIQPAISRTAHAGGAADAITATFTNPPTTFVDGLSYYVRAASANATTTPTFTPNSGTLAAHTIVKGNGAALAAGDIAGAGHWLELQYDTTLTAWVLLNPATGIAAASVASIQGAFKNLQASATGLNATVTVSADEIAVENVSNAYATLRSVSLSINSAASGANGLDTGTLAGSTWYSVWVIWNGTTAAGLLSASATAPTMPSGYTHKARIGWVRTDGTANKYPLGFDQVGKLVQYRIGSGNVANMPIISSGAQGNPATPTWVAIGVSAVVPPTAAAVNLVAFTSGTSVNISVAPNNAYGTYGSTTNPAPLVSATSTSGGQISIQGKLLLESSNVYVASTSGTGLSVFGWEDGL